MKLKDVSVGDRVQVDDGFTCIEPWSILTVEADTNGRLFVPCSHNRHYLNGQADANGKLIGVRPEGGEW